MNATQHSRPFVLPRLLGAFRQWNLVIILLTVVLFQSCSRNPATGERHLNLVSEDQEIALGKDADKEISASMGVYDNARLQSYVESIGKALAAKSERPNLPWTFRVIDDPLVNAFALPGGFIYVTRGILSHMDNEAQLAGVLGHEIGHVTAKHSVNRMSTQQLAQLGLGIGMILSPTVREYGQLASVGLGLLFLKFSRDDESQADELGFRYVNRNGDDPREMIGIFTMLDRVSQQSGGGGMPEWLATHPNPGNRREHIEEMLAAEGGNVTRRGGTVDRDEYLEAINGITYGENPRDGFFRGALFYHPEMQFSFKFPDGWKTVNQKQLVGAQSPQEDAVIQITLAQAQSPDAAAQQFFGQKGMQSSGMRPDQANGIPMTTGTFSAQTEQGVLGGIASFFSYGGQVFQVLGYTAQGTMDRYNPVFQSALHSFNKVTDPAILSVQPAKLEVVTLPRAMTIEQFAQQYPTSTPVEQLALINQVEKGATMEAGKKVKRVTGGTGTK